MRLGGREEKTVMRIFASPDLLREFQKIRGGEAGEKPSIITACSLPETTSIKRAEEEAIGEH